MTTTAPRPSDHPAATDAADGAWRTELMEFLRPDVFPARLDELQASLIRHHAPSRLRRLGPLSHSRRYVGVAEVLDDIVSNAPEPAAHEPI